MKLVNVLSMWIVSRRSMQFLVVCVLKSSDEFFKSRAFYKTRSLHRVLGCFAKCFPWFSGTQMYTISCMQELAWCSLLTRDGVALELGFLLSWNFSVEISVEEKNSRICQSFAQLFLGRMETHWRRAICEVRKVFLDAVGCLIARALG